MTATNRIKYDCQAFTNIELNNKSVQTSATDDQIALRRIEAILGDETVSLYKRLFAMPIIMNTMLPDINAYFIWTHLKTSTQNLELNDVQGSDFTHHQKLNENITGLQLPFVGEIIMTDTSANIQLNQQVTAELIDQSTTSFEQSSASTQYQVVIADPTVQLSSLRLEQSSVSAEKLPVIAEPVMQSGSSFQQSTAGANYQLVIASSLQQSSAGNRDLLIIIIILMTASRYHIPFIADSLTFAVFLIGYVFW